MKLDIDPNMGTFAYDYEGIINLFKAAHLN